jgi:uncharacterized membrane protein YdjX (TVP38/TMEM64 family)
MRNRAALLLAKPIAGILLVGALIWMLRALGLSAYVSLEEIRPMVESMGPYGPLAFVGLCVAGVLLHLPEIVLIAIGGVVFGGVKGFVLGWVGSVAGSTSSFLVARYFLRYAFREAITSRSRRLLTLDERLQRHGFLTVLSLRLVLFMAPPLNWAIGVTRVRFRDYFLGSAIGVIPCTAVTCYAADAISQAGSFSAILMPGTILPAALAVVFVAASAFAVFRFFR